ncbi:MAG: PD40 domain-containing protein, partial [Duodenibacillus sp.]|nr:PD40 domain-containing protein [Duodenibacillus sp.]
MDKDRTARMQRRALLGACAAGAALAAAGRAAAQLQVEISGVGANRLPVGLMGLHGSSALQADVMGVVAADLSRSGDFRLAGDLAEAGLEESVAPRFEAWRAREAVAVATGSIARRADGGFDIRYGLYDTVKEERIDELALVAGADGLRMAAHRIADRIYDKLTGMGAMFASRLAYVAQRARNRYELIVADSDGANARPALVSSEPIISPAWSPDGSKLAYVSFERRKPVVYVHDVATGQRHPAASFPGNNSAPAFSPDGKSLAVALSRNGLTQVWKVPAAGGGG